MPDVDPVELKRRLYDEHRVETPVHRFGDQVLLRISIATYNTTDDVEARPGPSSPLPRSADAVVALAFAVVRAVLLGAVRLLFAARAARYTASITVTRAHRWPCRRCSRRCCCSSSTGAGSPATW